MGLQGQKDVIVHTRVHASTHTHTLRTRGQVGAFSPWFTSSLTPPAEDKKSEKWGVGSCVFPPCLISVRISSQRSRLSEELALIKAEALTWLSWDDTRCICCSSPRVCSASTRKKEDKSRVNNQPSLTTLKVWLKGKLHFEVFNKMQLLEDLSDLPLRLVEGVHGV